MIRVGVDWGSTSLRAYRFDEQGTLLAELSAPNGVRNISSPTPENYENILFDLIGDWLSDGDVVLLSGMITSRSGWVETPYLACPVDVTTIASYAHSIKSRNVELRFLPGIKQEIPTPDVMRGEELQLLGASDKHGNSTVVLPGTHSKWAVMNGSVLSRFRTVVTGELFEILCNHSLVGAMFTSDRFSEKSFFLGVKVGYNTTTLVADIFTLRAAVLLEQANSDTQHSYLSGLLIGNEIREGLQLMGTESDIVLLGSEALCELYQLAFKRLNVASSLYTDIAAVSGFQAVIKSYAKHGELA